MSFADSSGMSSPVRSLTTAYSASNPNSTSNLNINHQNDTHSRYDSPRRGPEHSDGEFLDMDDVEDEGEDEEDEEQSTGPRGRRNTDPERDADSTNNPYGGLASAQAASSAPNLHADDFPMPPSTASPKDQTSFSST